MCGLLDALPKTAVIVRSSANVNAGAKTKASGVLHGVWLLLFAAAMPWALALIPFPALAGILVHAGWKLIPFRQITGLWQSHKGEALILVITAVVIVAVNMFEGVLTDLALAVISLGGLARQAGGQRQRRRTDPDVPVGLRDLPQGAEDPRQP